MKRIRITTPYNFSIQRSNYDNKFEVVNKTPTYFKFLQVYKYDNDTHGASETVVGICTKRMCQKSRARAEILMSMPLKILGGKNIFSLFSNVFRRLGVK